MPRPRRAGHHTRAMPLSPGSGTPSRSRTHPKADGTAQSPPRRRLWSPLPPRADRLDRRTGSEHRGQSRLEVRKHPRARDLRGIHRGKPGLGRQTLERAGSRERERPGGARRRRRHQRAEGGDVGSRLATLGTAHVAITTGAPARATRRACSSATRGLAAY